MRAGGGWLLVVGLLMLPGLSGCGRSLADGGGRLMVIDGDTLSLNGELIQLAGMDAPELGQQCLDGETLYACGLAAAFGLQKILMLEQVVCSSSPDDGGHECHTADGPLSARLVEDGLAVADPGSELETAQDKARKVPLGIWRGGFVMPRAWRQGARLPAERNGTDGCPVLGVSEDGRLGYRVPTDPDYEAWLQQTNAIVARFCSDEEARAAGYVHA